MVPSTHMLVYNHLALQFQGIRYPLLVCTGCRHACGTRKCIQKNKHIHAHTPVHFGFDIKISASLHCNSPHTWVWAALCMQAFRNVSGKPSLCWDCEVSTDLSGVIGHRILMLTRCSHTLSFPWHDTDSCPSRVSRVALL